MQAHKKMVDDLLSFNINETDRVIWFDVLPNRPGSNKGPPLANSFHCWRNGLFIQIYIDTYIYIFSCGFNSGKQNSAELACRPSWRNPQLLYTTWGWCVRRITLSYVQLSRVRSISIGTTMELCLRPKPDLRQRREPLTLKAWALR